MQRELPARLAVLLRRFARRGQHVRWDAGDARLIDHDRERLGRIQQVFREAAAELRELLLDGGEARLLAGRELRAAEAEVAQRVVDDPAPRGAERRIFGRVRERLVFVEQRLVLPEFRPVLGELRQVGVVRLAQLGTVQHRVQVRDLPPGAADVLVRVLERRDECVPGDRRREHALDGGAAFGEQCVYRRGDVLGPELREARQSGEI